MREKKTISHIINGHSQGFTFVELMVVMVIISMGMFLLVPKVVSGLLDRQNPITEEFNSVLKEAKKKAVKDRQKIGIRFVMGSEHFYLDDKEYTLPGERSVNRAWLNEEQTSGMEFFVNAYPDGICDYFVIELSGGLKIKSNPLLCEVIVERSKE